MECLAGLTLAQSQTTRSNEQLEMLLQGWVGLAMLAALGALGLAVIAVLLAVWRRSLARHRTLEEEIQELRSSVTAMGDAWAASSTRMGGPGPQRPTSPDIPDDDDDEEEEEDDPFNLFGGRDPLDGRDDDDAEDDEDYFDDDEMDDPPPGF